MKRHPTASAVKRGTPNEAGAGSVAVRTNTTFENGTRARAASSRPNLALASVTPWTHTLVLTGELNYRSAHALEAEIEHLCEKGVTGITLDLRKLTYIDPVGVAVITFRCRLCKRHGFDFSLIPGPRVIHRAFEQAGVTHLLPFQDDEAVTPSAAALVLSHRSRDGCEQ
jgi:anti-anti-sigma factor